MKAILSILLLGSCLIAQAQTKHTHLPDRAIDFPNVPGYLTLKSDLHLHTVFSDGSVWPDIRVEEAQRDNLDIISITEHLEEAYLPHLEDISNSDRNRANDIAMEHAKNSSLIVVKGSEISRSMPPGHANAIFLKDANKLLIDDPVKSFKEAHDQGAFIFWNHPNWSSQRSDGIATMTKMHEELIKKGYLNGIEVVNELTYSDEALQLALDYNLTIMGTSDVHGLIDWLYEIPEGGHRPITLIFAKERTEESIKKALFERRTVVWFDDILIGRENMLKPLIEASVKIEEEAEYIETWSGITKVLSVKFTNTSDASYLLYNKSEYTFHTNSDVIMLEPQSVTTIEVKTIDLKSEIDLKFTVLSAVTAPNTHPDVTWKVKIKKTAKK